MYYSSSLDGVTWEDPTFISNVYISSAYSSAYFDGSYVHYVVRPSSGMTTNYYRGIPYSNGTIVWGIGPESIDSLYTSIGDPSIAINSTNSVFVGVNVKVNALPGIGYVYTRNDTGVWSNYTLNSTARRYFGNVLPLSGPNVYAINFPGFQNSSIGSYPTYGRLWNGSAWSEQEVITTLTHDTDYYGRESATSFNNEIHLVFLENQGDNITYIKYSNNNWGTPIVLNESATNSSPAISIDDDTGDLYVIWTNNNTKKIYYMKYDNSSSSWDNSPNVIYTDSDGFSRGDTIACSHHKEEDYISVIYTANISKPRYVKHFYFNKNTVLTQPLCRISINDTNGDEMIVKWYENTSDWTLRQTNSTVVNGTYTWQYTQAVSGDTKYWWRVCVTDGEDWVNETYCFKTQDETIISDVSPSSWNGGTPFCKNTITENFTFYQNGTATINVTIGFNDTNYTYVNWSTYDTNGHDQYTANFTNDSWVTESNIVAGYSVPWANMLNAGLSGNSNFTFGIRIWMPKSVSVDLREDFEVILEANDV